MVYFRAFGQVIRSELALPEFEPIAPGANTQPDVHIVRAKLPPVPRDTRNAGFFRVANGAVEFEAEGIVRIRVAARDLIEVDVLDDAREAEARLYVTGSGFGAWTFFAGRFPFHCGLVTISNQDARSHTPVGLAITGPSGVGKSTLTTALVQRGLGFMSDDVVVLDPIENGEIGITPSFARIKLWQDAADHFAIATGGLSRLHRDMEKFHVPFPQDSVIERARLGAVFRLRFDDETDKVACRRLPFPEALLELRSNIYRLDLVPALGLEEKVFELVSAILQQVPVFDLVRPRDYDRFDEAIDAILNEAEALA